MGGEKNNQSDNEVEEKEEKCHSSSSLSSDGEDSATDNEADAEAEAEADAEAEIEVEAEAQMKDDQPAEQLKDPVDEEVSQQNPHGTISNIAAETDKTSVENPTNKEDSSLTPPQTTTTNTTGEDTETQASSAYSPHRTVPDKSDNSESMEMECNGGEETVEAMEESNAEKPTDEALQEEERGKGKYSLPPLI